MAKNKNFRLVKAGTRHWIVFLKSSGQSVAILYQQSEGNMFRFRLNNYPQGISKVYQDEKQALLAIEREVL